MSAARQPQELLARARQPYAPARWVPAAAAGCLVLGLLGFGMGLLVAPQWAWGALLANFLFWTGLAQAAVVVAAVFVLAPARWGRVFQRMALGLSASLPFSLVLLLALWVGRRHLLACLETGDCSPWLLGYAPLARDAFILLVLGGLSLWFVALSLRPDLGAWGDAAPDPRFRRWLTRGWHGTEAERDHSLRWTRTLAPAVVIGYAFGYSVLAIDWAMALAPGFRSTMYPGIYFLSEFYAALAVTAVLAAVWCRSQRLGGLIAPAQSRDLGNLVWGFAIFWAYVSWAQYAVIWYANLPPEAAYVAQRYRTQPWGTLSWIGLAATFVVPFLLLFSRALKRDLGTLAVVAGIGAAGVLLQRFLDVLPFVPRLGSLAGAPVALAVTIGFLGLVALPYLWLMRRVPLFPVTDPLFLEAVAVAEMEG